jgi:hypothetical protein
MIAALAGASGLAANAVTASTAQAQSIKKVGADVHHTLKKAGNDVKAAAGDVGSAAHHTLTKAGNETKTEAGDVTGIHKVGGTVGATARKVSHGGKKIARGAKHQLKTSKAKAHGDLTKAGKDAKADVKKP